MTSKDFRLIAEVLAKFEPIAPATRRGLALDFAAELRRTNPRFDRERFLEACKGAGE